MLITQKLRGQQSHRIERGEKWKNAEEIAMQNADDVGCTFEGHIHMK
jgi:hypothetical protein